MREPDRRVSRSGTIVARIDRSRARDHRVARGDAMACTLLCCPAMNHLEMSPPTTAAPPARAQLTAAALGLARARLVQFLAIGGAIFLAAPPPRDDRRIEISAQELAIVQAAQADRDGAPLGPARAAEVTARVVEDRLLFREGVRLGLDQGDPIIEQRVVQKLLLLAESLGGATREPSDAELRAAYQRNAARYQQAPRYHVMHVFAGQRDDLPAAGGLDPAALPRAGEPFPLPREVHATLDELRRSYGAGFAQAVAALVPGPRYSEPVASSFGWHRVRLVDVAPGGPLPFDAVKRQIAFDLALARREDTVRRFLDETAARYDIVVAGAHLARFQPLLRLARHEAASGED
jgi:PPIC-type PPIASE domain